LSGKKPAIQMFLLKIQLHLNTLGFIFGPEKLKRVEKDYD